MTERIVRHALFTYRDADGVRHTAFRGDKVDLDGKELERAERFGAVGEDDLSAASPTVLQPAPPVAAAEAGKLLDAPAEKPARRPAVAKD